MNHHEEEEEELKTKFPYFKYFIDYEATKPEINYKGSYRATLLQKLKKGDTKTVANYQEFCSAQNIQKLQLEATLSQFITTQDPKRIKKQLDDNIRAYQYYLNRGVAHDEIIEMFMRGVA